MNRETLDNWCERGILGLVLAVLIYGPLATGAVRAPDFLVLQALTVGVLALWVVRLWLNPRPQLLWPPICWPVLAFTVYAVVRYFTADLEYVARIEMVRVLIYACLFFAIVNNLHRQEHTRLISFVLIFLAMAISGYAIYQFMTGSDKVWGFSKPYTHRGSGTYISPNHLAGFLEMILPLGLAWTLVSRAKVVMKILTGYASLVMLVGVAMTVSRGGWVSVGLALTAFFGVLVFQRNYRLPSIVMLTIIVGAGVYFIPRTHFFQARLKEIAANDRLDDSARFQLWPPAIRMWRENPWWGVGPNHFNARFRAYRPQAEQRQPDRVHNDYLNTLTDWGVAGAMLVALAAGLAFAGALKTWRVVRGTTADLGGRSSNKFALVLGTSAGLLAIMIHSLVDFNMHIPANAILAVTLVAMLSSSLRFTSDRYWVGVKIGTRMLATLILLAAAGYLTAQGIRRGMESVWLKRERQAPAYSPEQVAALEHAFAVEPRNAQTAFKIGKAYRAQGWDNGDTELVTKAAQWFKRSMELDPFDGYGYLEYGICLDWPLERREEARPYFDKAVQLDPNGYYTVGYMGWHYFQTGDYAAAKAWFERSKRLEWNDNKMADTYLEIVNQRMKEAANPAPAAGTTGGTNGL